TDERGGGRVAVRLRRGEQIVGLLPIGLVRMHALFGSAGAVDEQDRLPAAPASASSRIAISSRGASSSSFTISSPRLAVERQCTLRRDSPRSYSRTEWRSKPLGRRS